MFRIRRQQLIRAMLLAPMFLAVASAALLLPETAHGATFTVNSTNSLDDGTCNATHCSLHEAIDAANAAGGPDTIAFNIGGGGAQTISVSPDPLPAITSPLTIDGTTQPAYAGSPLIRITDTGAISAGLTVQSAGVLIRGLSITAFDAGILIDPPGGATIQGNYIGLAPNGSVVGNDTGIDTRDGSNGNQIGGTTPAARNVISGNTSREIRIDSDDNVIEGNYIGTNATGMIGVGAPTGISITLVDGNRIGGLMAAARNVISGHSATGILAAGDLTDIHGNYIGLSADGTAAIPNGIGVSIGTNADSVDVRGNVVSNNTDYGIHDAGSSDSTVIEDNLLGVGPDGVTPMGNGDGTAGDAAVYVSNTDSTILNNVVAYTAGRGIRVAVGTTPTIRGNSIFLNDGLGIDIGDDNAVDAPCCITITSAVTQPGVTIISGHVIAPMSTVWVLDFYDSAACDLSGFGEGERYLGQQVVPMGGSTFVPFNFLTPLGVTPGRVVTGTVNATSEFSSCVAVPACGAGDPDCDGWASPQQTKHPGPTNNDTATDNCVSVWNTPQGNTDGNFVDNSPPYASGADDKTWIRSDAQGNDCDPDDDNDGLDDNVEPGLPYAPCPTASGPTDPLLRDTDGDRFLDGPECTLGFDPVSSASKPALSACGPTGDTDGDRVTDRVEVCNYNSNPGNADSDGDVGLDGAKDGCEVGSINGDRVINAGDQLLLAQEIVRVPPPAKLVNFDLNKDGSVSSGDQLLMAFFISPPGQCP
jgi:hypothetical protein